MSYFQKLTHHKTEGWQGQYNRALRWKERYGYFEEKELFKNTKTNEYFDTLYACFQNIFMLKDWLIENTKLTKTDLNLFINSNPEIGLCRDICNGTKHFNLLNPSISKDLGIINELNPLSKINKQPQILIIIISGNLKFSPLKLIEKNFELWDWFIDIKLGLKKF